MKHKIAFVLAKCLRFPILGRFKFIWESLLSQYVYH